MSDNAAFGDRPFGGDHPGTTQPSTEPVESDANTQLESGVEGGEDVPFSIADIPMGDEAAVDANEGDAVAGQDGTEEEREQGQQETGVPEVQPQEEDTGEGQQESGERDQETEKEQEIGGAEDEGQEQEQPTVTVEDLGLGDDQGDGGDATGMIDFDGEHGFDPATLANLAALSRIGVDEEEGEGGEGQEGEGEGGEDDLGAVDFAALLPSIQEVAARAEREEREREGREAREDSQREDEAREGRQDDRATTVDRDTGLAGSRDVTAPSSPDGPSRSHMDHGDDDQHDHDREEGDDDDFLDPRFVYEDGRMKRKRNRTVLSCTECHRRCDRNIPCSRCIKRGVASMCRMEAPPLPERKKRKMVKDVPVNYELGVRVQALESLIRSGSSLDPDSAQNAAMETILHATRAAESGSLDASSALAQLTESAMAGGGIGSMSQDAQSSLLMDVLQQLSVASLSKNNTEGDGPRTGSTKDIWSSTPSARADAASRAAAAYTADTAPQKINISLPGFREDNGKIFVPPTVRYVDKQLRNEDVLGTEALPIWGDDKFLEEGVKFAYGTDHMRYHRSWVSRIQATSLTGALRLAGTFLARFPAPPGRQIFLPTPTTEEDTIVLRDAGLEVRHYRFLDRKTGAVDFDGVREDLLAAPEKSIVLLYVSGTIPTGAELTAPQWRLITTILHERHLIPLVVMAFQGLASGDTAKDAQPLRLMAHEGLPIVLCQNFDAMMGLYADSPAIVSVVTQSEESKDRVDSQLRAVARSLHAHPSPWGARIASTILSDPKLHPAWLAEIKAMSDRLRSVRDKLHDLLANKFKTPGSWAHVKKSTGMYCTTLLPPLVNDALTAKRHVHLLPYGSFSLGCLNASKIEALARAIDSVVLTSIREAEEAQAQQIAMELALAAAREAAAREEAEAAAQAAREEDQMLMERSIQSAIDAQRRAEEDERRREEEERGLEEAVRKAAERAETARQAEAILATITAGQAF